MNKRRFVYLDNAATTPVDTAVFKKMQPYFFEQYGNPSTIYNLGEKANQAVENARNQIANFLKCSSNEIYFTSSASESDNWIIYGLLFNKKKKIHIITSVIEHKAILEPCKNLEEEGIAEITYLPINESGLIEINSLEKAIKKNTLLVSIMYANSEIGTVQPIEEMGALIKRINSKRKEKIIFHTDAVQAVNYLNCDVQNLGVDSLSLSGHKIYGPKGIGALYIRSGISINPLIHGGGQEKGMRSGTENVPGIVGLGEAVKKVQSSKSKVQKIKVLRNKLITGILKDIPDSQFNGSLEKRLPNNAHISFKGAEGESIVIELSQKDIFVSTGSACASKSLSPSHVLTSLGLSHEESHCSIRFTLGRQTKDEDINYVLKVLPGIIKRLRKISGR